MAVPVILFHGGLRVEAHNTSGFMDTHDTYYGSHHSVRVA